jgi:hypothetical protein
MVYPRLTSVDAARRGAKQPPGDPSNHDRLFEVLTGQAYREVGGDQVKNQTSAQSSVPAPRLRSAALAAGI